jgi:uncharacterized damage-inducible protein DinB
MKRQTVLALALAASPGALAAQMTAAMQPLFESGKQNLIKAAEAMTEANYAFKPVATVRSFGEIVGHLANENYLMCAPAMGKPNPMASKDYEKVTAKAELVAALKASLAFCDEAYRLPDARLGDPVELFGIKNNKLWAITLNLQHNGEHYGNLATYMRIKGMVPPSSQGGP